METLVIKLDPKANQSKLIEAIEMLKGVKSVTLHTESEPNAETIKAMKDAADGKVNRYSNSKELFSNIRKKANV